MSIQWIFIQSTFIIFFYIQLIEGIKCFCDRNSCEDNQVCHSKYCIIGLTNDDSINNESTKLRQLCGNGDIVLSNIGKCDEKSDGWQEVCYCNEEFCNTFAFLRQSMDMHSEPIDRISNGYDSSSSNINDIYSSRSSHEGGGRQHRSSLIVLLVIIPLSVGGLAVCLIFLNYHCKMC